MNSPNNVSHLFSLLDNLNKTEQSHLSSAACFSVQAVRRHEETQKGHRQEFALDADRILHSRAYTRYIDKTQVFCLINNDHITHRVLHVQLVSRIARTIGRFLRLNEDLIEAIAMGHDIGHPPFGHDGEHILSTLCIKSSLPAFQHNIQSVIFLDNLERKGKGWNLSVQTLDGILCHDGEIHNRHLTHTPDFNFEAFDKKLQKKSTDPKHNLLPMTLEGCVVRLADTIGYIGRDIEDAILLGLIKREDLPKNCTDILGSTNGAIVYNLVTDLITNSYVPGPETSPGTIPTISFSDKVSETLQELKIFNYNNIYLNPAIKTELPLIQQCYTNLFEFYLDLLSSSDFRHHNSPLHINMIRDMEEKHLSSQPPAVIVRDFIAGMTDDFFLQQAQLIGCTIPQKKDCV